MVLVGVGLLATLSLAVHLYTRLRRPVQPSAPGQGKESSSPPPYSAQTWPAQSTYSGVLELVCHRAREDLHCAYCAGGPSQQMIEIIEQNLKHSLNLPLQSSVTITTHLDRSDWQGPTLLDFNTRLSMEEHMDMINQKMVLIRKMTDSMTDKVYLDSPSKIANHSLSLYRINC